MSGAQTLTPYEPPGVVVLGTLEDLTQGGDVNGPADGYGASGDEGSV